MAFDLDRYKEICGRLDYADLDLQAAFDRRPLLPDLLRVVRYMHDVEHHTTCYMRNLLNTKAHDDPDITAFLTFWNFEEHWHGEALADVLRAHGEPGGAPRVAAMRQRLGNRITNSPLVWGGISSVTKHFLAVHMTFGVINEWTTQAGYARLAARLILRTLWRPVGATVMPEPETAHVIRTLFGGDRGHDLAARIDRRIDNLPGLEGMGLIDGVLRRYAA